MYPQQPYQQYPQQPQVYPQQPQGYPPQQPQMYPQQPQMHPQQYPQQGPYQQYPQQPQMHPQQPYPQQQYPQQPQTCHQQNNSCQRPKYNKYQNQPPTEEQLKRDQEMLEKGQNMMSKGVDSMNAAMDKFMNFNSNATQQQVGGMPGGMQGGMFGMGGMQGGMFGMGGMQGGMFGMGGMQGGMFANKNNQSEASNNNSLSQSSYNSKNPYTNSLPTATNRSEVKGKDDHENSTFFDHLQQQGVKSTPVYPHLNSIKIYHTDNMIVGIECTYKFKGENSIVGPFVSKGTFNGDVQTKEFQLQYGESISEISGRCGDSIDRLMIKTDKGNCIEVGGNGGSPFSNIVKSVYNPLIGFGGSTREFLDSLYIVYL
ncbi:jacalin-like lectin domain protein (macronuclear) [Tetrahymena thermophila SB210]|uniref:Jacalin-like lectin domain protein n=1 Tax=Tetrahymena thermophila (strain SB210) TaxID=312017 RepID=Q22AF8_TETTS|nr:jacalin-like lectin domain protein [Tetrahymena thermophila SB210]EAR82284.1 jacalin-like lectin domain protein [Tetrahymena thermophila SB210]|eukprot:XP_001029947.1 jacalin-like lectin domain protein [Tetrahymena thermophila SB210]